MRLMAQHRDIDAMHAGGLPDRGTGRNGNRLSVQAELNHTSLHPAACVSRSLNDAARASAKRKRVKTIDEGVEGH
jgi:hypothetical protein